MNENNVKKQRISYWDNMKFVLIFFVVVGHYLIPIGNKGGYMLATYNWIYFFHMPAFVFISGFFSKSFVKNEEGRTNKILGYLILYGIYEVALWGIDYYIVGNKYDLTVFTPLSAPWYMLAMVIWLILIPYFKNMNPVWTITALIIIGTLAGTDKNIGPLMSMSRVIILLPFFVAGYWFDGELINRIKLLHRVLAVIFLVVMFVAIFIKYKTVNKYMTIFYCNRGYGVANVSNIKGCILRIIFYGIAFVMTAAVMCLIPKKKYFFTFMGERSLSVFIIHRLLRDILVKAGLYNQFSSNGKSLIMVMILCLAITAFSSLKVFDIIFRKILQIKLIKENKELCN